MPKRQVFYSFHYVQDNWRTAMVRNIGVVEGNKSVSDNEWETVKKGGDNAIKQWIDKQMRYRSCTIVLVGSETADRKWINYEITKSWNEKMGVVGIYIHGLKNQDEDTSCKGKNPFDYISLPNKGQKLSDIVKCYDPLGNEKYNWISKHLPNVVEEAIQIRNQYD